MSKPGGWSRVARLCLPVVVTVGLCSGALVSVATTTPPAGAEVAPDLPDAAPAPTDLGISASTALSAMAMTAKFGYCIHTGPSDGSSDVL
ncbi:MAG TPA: hypothetical protein VMF35_14960, partial [Acidimicrobiales bacterium]|nr:hypothetical protein [Acidimicrobiales bacterium]